jgi:hypothetical protein
MRVVSKGVVVLVGLLAVHSATSTGQQLLPPTYDTDPRLQKLKSFFQQLESPAVWLAEDFLVAADRHGLDWRLLPSISIVESGGGKVYMNNNILGWDSCRTSFPSVEAGIDLVAARLAKSTYYKDKDLDEKLAAYNPNSYYPRRVKSLMERLGPGRRTLSSPD